MNKFAPSIKEKYKDRLINREKQWPPRHSNKLVCLQLVQTNKGEGSSAIVQRGKHDEAVKLTPLAYIDLFKGENEKHRVRKILVEGDAGIGKTTLSISLSEDWASGKLFQEFELLLLLPLRQKKVASAGSLRDLLKLFHSSSNICESVASYLEEEEAKKVLIIADGWDELGESEQTEESFLYRFLFEMFPFMSVVVTSRPSASDPLHNLPYIDRFVHVSGFSKENIQEYIQSEFSDDQEKACRLLEHLEYNPLIESVCSIPLNCAIVCHLWHILEEALPSTMTQLYTKLMLYIICRNLRKLEAYGPTLSMSSFNELPEGLQQSWWLLCQFACEALDKDEIIFSKKKLLKFFPQGLSSDDKILCFGLLQSVETVLDVTCVVCFNFLHLTFMEYLAALYLTRQPLERQLEFLKKHHYTMIPRFFFGICFSDTTKHIDTQYVIKCIDSINIYFNSDLNLCHCAFEAHNKLINDEVIKVIMREDTYGNSLGVFYTSTAHDCTAMLYIIENMQKCSNLKLYFRYSGITERQIRSLTCILASKRGKIKLKMFDLCGINLFQKTISDNYYHGTRDADNTATVIEELVAHCPHLETLFLSQNNLGVPGAAALARGISKSQHQLLQGGGDLQLKSLDSLLLDHNNLGDQGLCAFINNLDCICHINTLRLDSNGIHATGVSRLATALFSGKIVITGWCTTLDLSNNPLGLEGAMAICTILRFVHSTFPRGNVKLSNCELTTAGDDLSDTDSLNLRRSHETVRNVGKRICQDLTLQNDTITMLFLDSNSFTGEGIYILAAFANICIHLKYLYCRDCEINSDDLMQLFNELSRLKLSSSICSELLSWNLRYNEIDDSGVLALIDYLPSLFPKLGMFYDYHIYLDNNPISSEMAKRFNEELTTRAKVRCC